MAIRDPHPALRWRYSARWSQPHKACPGEICLASALVRPGEPCPPEIAAHATPGSGYAITVDFLDSRPARTWSAERRAAMRKRNLAARIERMAPLFSKELIARELEARPNYFAGERPTFGRPKENSEC